MPRIRTIKPEFWSSPGVAKMSPLARLTFIGMWNWADDAGRGTYNPRELMGFIFPNDEDMTVAEFRRLCAETRRYVAVVFFEVAGRHYYYIPSWKKHQSRHAKFNGSKFPSPDDGMEIDPENMQVIDGFEERPRDSAESPRISATSNRDSAIGTGEQGNRGTGEQIYMSEPSSDVEVAQKPPTKPAPKRNTYPPAFEAWWRAYPRHRNASKKQALESWRKATKQIPPAELQSLTERYAATHGIPDESKIPHPTTWLNQSRWETVDATDKPAEPQRVIDGTRPEDWAIRRGEPMSEMARNIDRLFGRSADVIDGEFWEEEPKEIR